MRNSSIIQNGDGCVERHRVDPKRCGQSSGCGSSSRSAVVGGDGGDGSQGLVELAEIVELLLVDVVVRPWCEVAGDEAGRGREDDEGPPGDRRKREHAEHGERDGQQQPDSEARCGEAQGPSEAVRRERAPSQPRQVHEERHRRDDEQEEREQRHRRGHAAADVDGEVVGAEQLPVGPWRVQRELRSQVPVGLGVDVEEVEGHGDRSLLAGIEFDRHARRVGQEREADHLALESEVTHGLGFVAGVGHHHDELGFLGRERERARRVGVVERDSVDRCVDLDHCAVVVAARAEEDTCAECRSDEAAGVCPWRAGVPAGVHGRLRGRDVCGTVPRGSRPDG